MSRAADVYAIGDMMPEDETLPLYCRACGRVGNAVILDDEPAT